MGFSVEELLARMEANPQNLRFADLAKVCDSLFGDPRQS